MCIATQFRRRKIGNVKLDFVRLNSRQHGVIINQSIAREIEQDGMVAHQVNALRINKMARLIQQRYVQADEIGGFDHLFHALGFFDLRRQTPCAFHRDLRIIADHFHSQFDGGFGYQ